MYSKRNVMICIAVLLAVVMGLVVYTSVKPKSPETEVSSTENTAAVDSAKICAVSYDIDLKLDPKKERVEQTVFMDIANKSGDEEFSSLYIRYYPNGYIDALVKENPEIKEYVFVNEDKFIVIASDGVWEFISNEEVVNIVKDFYLNNDIEASLNYLYKEASKRWIMEEEIIDDITIIIIFLN